MESIAEGLLKKYIDPVVAIVQDGTVLFANDEALHFFGPLDGRKCYEFIYKRPNRCPLCVRNDLKDRGWVETIRRCRFIKDKYGEEDERYAVVTPYDAGSIDKCHVEIYAPVPMAIQGMRAIMVFAGELEGLTHPDDVLHEVVEFVSSDRTSLKCRTRLYSLEPDGNRLVLKFHDNLSERPSYIDDIDNFVITRQSKGQFSASFACVDENRWFILTPNLEEEVTAFGIHFRAQVRNNEEKLWDADKAISQLQMSLCQYDKDCDGVPPVFKEVKPHTFLDIPIGTKHKVYGKLTLTLWGSPFLFYREHIEELRLIENFVSRRLTAIEALEETRAAVSRNVIHEVAQPTFAGLTSMEALRRRDRENGVRVEDDQIDYYLKKNVECSLKMVAFLNDRARIDEGIASASDTAINFLSNVIAPVVSLARFGIYEKYLRDTGETMDKKELEDIPLQRIRSTGGVKSVFSGITYEIVYSSLCDTIKIYVEKYRLQQVIYNLLNNALKYKRRKEDYRVKIKYREPLPIREKKLFAGYFVIDVTDEGFGVEDGEQEEIFGLCVRGKNADKISVQPGTGRGLYVCRVVLRGIGGEIFVKNMRSPTIFRLLIPRECAYPNWPSKIDELKKRTREIMKHIGEGE